MNDAALSALNISNRARDMVLECESRLSDVFLKIDETELLNQARVLAAFQRNAVSQRHFAPTSGYGYDDIGRDTLDLVFAHSLEAEDAIVRPQITSGTQAIFTALAGLLEPGDTMLSVTGAPYDTLMAAIGLSGDEPNSLKRMGIACRTLPLNNGKIDVAAAIAAAGDGVKVVYIQRSRGYEWREAILPDEMEAVISAVHKLPGDVAVVVDNCYGEFVREHEPAYYGADIEIGSLIKNPGGSIAPTGGYIAGKKKYVERIAGRLTVPGMGREVGSYAASYTPFYQGLFLAPHITAQSLKTAALFAALFESMGLTSMPKSDAVRSDIVQALRFKGEEGLIAFVESIQKAAPVDSFVKPVPWDMPGYTDKVIMAAGAFNQGSSIELSADGPIRPPYTAYVQGGITYSHGRIAAMLAAQALNNCE